MHWSMAGLRRWNPTNLQTFIEEIISHWSHSLGDGANWYQQEDRDPVQSECFMALECISDIEQIRDCKESAYLNISLQLLILSTQRHLNSVAPVTSIYHLKAWQVTRQGISFVSSKLRTRNCGMNSPLAAKYKKQISPRQSRRKILNLIHCLKMTVIFHLTQLWQPFMVWTRPKFKLELGGVGCYRIGQRAECDRKWFCQRTDSAEWGWRWVRKGQEEKDQEQPFHVEVLGVQQWWKQVWLEDNTIRE
jgi:hypothetical protein